MPTMFPTSHFPRITGDHTYVNWYKEYSHITEYMFQVLQREHRYDIWSRNITTILWSLKNKRSINIMFPAANAESCTNEQFKT